MDLFCKTQQVITDADKYFLISNGALRISQIASRLMGIYSLPDHHLVDAAVPREAGARAPWRAPDARGQGGIAPDFGIPELLRLLSGDCPKRNSLSAYDLCGEHRDVWGVWRQPARWALI